MEIHNPTTYEYNYDQTPPAFNTALGPVPGDVKERTVAAGIALSSGVTTGSSVNAEVETGVGTGVYELVGVRWRVGQDAVGNVMFSGTFLVPRGHRYRFEEDETGGSRTFVQYGFRDEVGA